MQATSDRDDAPGMIDAYYVFERLLDQTTLRAIAERQREEAVTAAREAANLLEKMGAELASERRELRLQGEEIGKLRCEVTALRHNEAAAAIKMETLACAAEAVLKHTRPLVRHNLREAVTAARDWLDARAPTF